MTLQQIMTTALAELDEDLSDLCEYEARFTGYANMGYRIALREYLRPRDAFTLRTDEAGMAVIDGMSIVRVVSVQDEKGRPVRFELSGDGAAIHTREKEKDVTLLCEVEYPPMTGGTDEPRLPEYAHGALVDYVCYRQLSSGNLAKQARAQYYLQQFYQVMQMLRPQGMGSVTGYRNLYESTGI